MKLLRYFDLNERRMRAWARLRWEQKQSNLDSGLGKENAAPPKSTGDTDLSSAERQLQSMSIARQLLMYGAVIVGVIFSGAIQEGKTFPTSLREVLFGLLVSGVIALILMPVVYEKVMVDPTAPLIVHLGLFVQHGVFWRVILKLLENAL